MTILFCRIRDVYQIHDTFLLGQCCFIYLVHTPRLSESQKALYILRPVCIGNTKGIDCQTACHYLSFSMKKYEENASMLVSHTLRYKLLFVCLFVFFCFFFLNSLQQIMFAIVNKFTPRFFLFIFDGLYKCIHLHIHSRTAHTREQARAHVHTHTHTRARARTRTHKPFIIAFPV